MCSQIRTESLPALYDFGRFTFYITDALDFSDIDEGCGVKEYAIDRKIIEEVRLDVDTFLTFLTGAPWSPKDIRSLRIFSLCPMTVRSPPVTKDLHAPYFTQMARVVQFFIRSNTRISFSFGGVDYEVEGGFDCLLLSELPLTDVQSAHKIIDNAIECWRTTVDGSHPMLRVVHARMYDFVESIRSQVVEDEGDINQ